jgi:hypothetical protein
MGNLQCLSRNAPKHNLKGSRLGTALQSGLVQSLTGVCVNQRCMCQHAVGSKNNSVTFTEHAHLQDSNIGPLGGWYLVAARIW